jgi:DNA-binding protein HU-beta
MAGQYPRYGAGNGNFVPSSEKRRGRVLSYMTFERRRISRRFSKIVPGSWLGPEESNLYKHNNKNMNKAGIAEAVHVVLGGTKVQAEQVVETVLNAIIDSLKKGEEVSIAGLGIFSVKMRAAREARNPRTGEAIKVAAMKVPKFRAAKALKDAVK